MDHPQFHFHLHYLYVPYTSQPGYEFNDLSAFLNCLSSLSPPIVSLPPSFVLHFCLSLDICTTSTILCCHLIYSSPLSLCLTLHFLVHTHILINIYTRMGAHTNARSSYGDSHMLLYRQRYMSEWLTDFLEQWEVALLSAFVYIMLLLKVSAQCWFSPIERDNHFLKPKLVMEWERYAHGTLT